MVAVTALALSLATIILKEKSEMNLEEQLPKITAEALASLPGDLRLTYKDPDTCTTAACVRASVYAMDSLDSSVKPCDDFFKFACGNFIKNTKLPEDKYAINPLSLITDKLQEQITKLVTEESEPNEAKPFRLAKDLYKACNNLSLIEELGKKPYLQILKRLGGWPVVVGDSWNSDGTWSWVETIKEFSKIGYDTSKILDLAISVDLKNSTKRIVDVS